MPIERADYLPQFARGSRLFFEDFARLVDKLVVKSASSKLVFVRRDKGHRVCCFSQCWPEYISVPPCVVEILEGADLGETTSKKVRQQLEKKLDVDLLERKKEIDELVMAYVNSKDKKKGKESEEEEDPVSEEEEVEDEEEEVSPL